MAIAAIVIAAFAIAQPNVPDLQAAIARERAADAGAGLGYWFSWFGGVSPGSYSLITPTVSQWLTSAGALCASTGLIVLLAPSLTRAYGAARPVWAQWTITIAALTNLGSGRVAFALGSLIAIIGLIAVPNRDYWRGLRLGGPGIGALIVALSGTASPLAPALTAAGATPFVVAAMVERRRNRRAHPVRGALVGPAGIVLVGALAGVLVPAFFFRNAGTQPFPVVPLLWALAAAAGAGYVLARASSLGLRLLVPICAVAAVVLFVIPTGVGSNYVRFFYLVLPAIVVITAATAVPRRILVLALAPALIYSATTVISDQLVAARLPENAAALYAPLKAELLRRNDANNHRVELIDTSNHAGYAELPPEVQLARGWENQSDRNHNPIFIHPELLTAANLTAWLADNAVRFIAIAREPIDRGKAEATLVRTLPGVSVVWRNANWTLYEVAEPTPIVAPPAHLVELGAGRLVVDVPVAGPRISLRLHPSRYLAATLEQADSDAAPVYGCLESAGEWMTIAVTQPGRYILTGTILGAVGAAPDSCTE